METDIQRSFEAMMADQIVVVMIPIATGTVIKLKLRAESILKHYIKPFTFSTVE
jgi:hypothetical protein